MATGLLSDFINIQPGEAGFGRGPRLVTGMSAFADLETVSKRGRLRLSSAVILNLVICPQVAMAFRPFDSTDASVAAVGEIELELGPSGYVGYVGQHFLVAPGVVLNFGVFSDCELVLQGRHLILVNGPAAEPRFRLVDTGLYLKRLLRRGSLQAEPGPSIAVEMGALLPTVNGELGSGASALAIVSQRLWPGTLHLNGAVALTRAHNLGLSGGVIFEGPNSWAIRPVAELLVETELEPALAFAFSGLVGAIWQVTDGLSFDAAVRIARINQEPVFEGRVGLTWATELWAPDEAPRSPAIPALTTTHPMEET